MALFETYYGCDVSTYDVRLHVHPVAVVSLVENPGKCASESASTATAAFLFGLFLSVALQNDEEAHKDADEVHQELKRVRHEVPPPGVRFLDDHLRVENDVAHEHGQSTIKLHRKEPRRQGAAHEEVEHPAPREGVDPEGHMVSVSACESAPRILSTG